MPAFRCEPLAELTRQLTFSPVNQRRRQIDRAEQLYWQLLDERNYPLDTLIYEITRHRPYLTNEAVTLVGQAVRADLLTLVEQLSASLDDRPGDFDPPPLDLDALARHWRVSKKTLSRYRRLGLFARKLIFPNGRRRLAFLHDSIERFETHHRQTLDRARRFDRIDEPHRRQIIDRARQLAASHPRTPQHVIHQVAEQLGRSPEAVRLVLRRHDDHADQPIFPRHHRPLRPDQQQAIFTDYHRGRSVASLARHYHRATDAIYRAINLRHAAALRRLRIDFIANPTFDLPDAEQIILAFQSPSTDSTARLAWEDLERPAGPAELLPPPLRACLDRPLPDRLTEQALFVRLNFLKYRARGLRRALDRYRPRFADLDRIETHLRHAASLRHRLARAYLPLVIAAAQKHAIARTEQRRDELLELICLGHPVLLDAIDHFDVSTGRRFDAFVNWRLLRAFAADRRWDQPALSLKPRPEPAAWPAIFNPDLQTLFHARHTAEQLDRILQTLDPRARRLVVDHLGLPDDGDCPRPPVTLADAAASVNLRSAVARRIEHQALLDLRRAAAETDIELDDWLPGPAW